MSHIPIRLGTLRPWQSVSFDVYIKVGDRYLHYIRKTDPFDGDRIRSLKAKGVKKLFILPDGESDYLRYLDEGLSQLSDKKVGIEDRAQVAADTMTLAAENAKQSIQSATAYADTQKQVQSVMGFVLNEKGAAQQMLSGGLATDVYQHSSHVVALSLNLAGQLGITDPKQLMNLGLGALLHDIGKEDSGLDATIPRESLSPEQLKIYQSHPERAVELVRDKPHVTREVVELILNHEEIGDGAGFPNRKRIASLPQIQQILNLCNEYDRVCTVNRVSPLDAIKQFRIDRIGLFDLDLVGQLAETLKRPS